MDDQELFRRGLTMLLAAEPGVEVVGEAGDGLEGTSLAATAAPDGSSTVPEIEPLETCANTLVSCMIRYVVSKLGNVAETVRVSVPSVPGR